MKYFSATYTDFVKFNKKPNEDFYLISKRFPIFAVADGVTQSRFRSGKYEGEYAFPAGAKMAAQIFCHSALEFLEKNFNSKKKNFEILIKQAFDSANQKIRELNIQEGIDRRLNYLEYDLFDTVGIVGFISGENLYYGYVGDCGLIIFDKNNKLKSQTEDVVLSALQRVRKIYRDWNKFSKEKQTLIMHRDLRNNPDKKGYGSFSGEDGVKKYYKINKKVLEPGDLAIFYSDGFIDYFKFKKFIEILRKQDKKSLNNFSLAKAKENNRKYGTDRTLISFIFQSS